MIASAVGRISVRSRRAFNVPGVTLDPVQLAAGLVGLAGYSQDSCRLRAVNPTVQLVEYRSSARGARMAVHGVHTCKSRMCPMCAPKWQRTRSDEITQALDRHPAGPDAVYFVTLTMRHNRRMPLSLQHRLLTSAFGNLWSGGAGQRAAAALGGKPESIRAHDSTWSRERAWHPHIHALLFADRAELEPRELGAMFDERWPDLLSSALRRFRRLCTRIIEKRGCRRWDCPTCYVRRSGPIRSGEGNAYKQRQRRTDIERLSMLVPARDQQECSHFRERGERLFGVRMFPRTRTILRDGKYAVVDVSIHDSALRVLGLLESFTPENIRPTLRHGAVVERVRDQDRLPKYLSKMGLELAASLDKLGSVGSDGVVHYGLWEVARLACAAGELRPAARKAWAEMFRATHGTQTITFSDREKLGLPDDPYADGQEPPERASDETSACIAEIDAPVYRELAREKEHGLLSELKAAYERGELAALSYVQPPPDGGRELPRGPPERGPPSTADPTAVDASGYLIERPEGAPRGGALSIADLLGELQAELEAGGSTRMGQAYRDATALPSNGTTFVESIQKRVRDIIYG